VVLIRDPFELYARAEIYLEEILTAEPRRRLTSSFKKPETCEGAGEGGTLKCQAASYGRWRLGAFVPVAEPDFGCSDSEFGGEMGPCKRPARPRRRVCRQLPTEPSLANPNKVSMPWQSATTLNLPHQHRFQPAAFLYLFGSETLSPASASGFR
jgi:hypothetical protein